MTTRTSETGIIVLLIIKLVIIIIFNSSETLLKGFLIYVSLHFTVTIPQLFCGLHASLYVLNVVTKSILL